MRDWGKNSSDKENTKKIESGLLNKYKYHNYDTNKSKNTQSNGETNLDKIDNQNIS